MFVGVVLFVLFCQVKGLVYECTENRNATVKFVPSEDGVRARYKIELCTPRNPNATEWDVNLWYYKNVVNCKTVTKYRPPFIHSVGIEDLNTINATCSNICYSMDFDLIFTGCYDIFSEFKNDGTTLQTVRSNRFTIKNNNTLATFANYKPQIVFIPNEEYVRIRWILGIPVSKPFTLELWRNSSNEMQKKDDSPNMSENCTVSASVYEVECKLVVGAGCYIATLQHNPLWHSVLNDKTIISYPFCVEHTDVVVSAESGGAWGWTRGALCACGAALALAAALLAAALARRGLIYRNFHKRVLERWRVPRESESSEGIVCASARGACVSRRVLLLYAREGECGARAVRALTELLRHATGEEVLDLYSPEVMALAGPAPGAWLRGVLAHQHTRVLLLQTPALAALYNTHLDHNNLNLVSPLLGRRAMYRAPQFGDQLLPAALRLVAETSAAHHHYHKYYFATYASLETDVLPAVVPFRRYVLPPAAHALLRDLTHDAHDAHEAREVLDAHDALDDTLMNHLESAVDDFVLHVKENQDYLMEDLMLI